MRSLALSMSGGGARAFCYYGFIRRLDRAGIPINYLAAHSGGALILCLLNSGMSDADAIREWSRFRYTKLLSLHPFSNGGLLSIEKYIAYMRRYTKGSDISQARIRTVIQVSDVTDFDNPHTLSYEQGDLARIAVVSSLIPPLFPLYEDNGRLLCDGGLTSTYSARYLRDRGVQVVVGLFPDALRYTKLPFSRLTTPSVHAQRSLIGQLKKIELRDEPVDMEIRGFASTAGLDGYKQAKELFKSGELKAEEVLPKLEALLSTPLDSPST